MSDIYSSDYYSLVEWNNLYIMDNVYPVTLMFKDKYWQENFLMESMMKVYCRKRNIDFALCFEVGQRDNLHCHGIMIYPNEIIKKRFQTWFNKIGKVYHSPKGYGYNEGEKWKTYCFKKNRH